MGYYARRDRDAAAAASHSSSSGYRSSSSYSRPSRFSSPDRQQRRSPPTKKSPSPVKLLSYWEDDNFADLQSFDNDNKKSKSKSKEKVVKEENPLPRMSANDYDFYCYDDGGNDSDEEFNLKYQSYYDMMEAG